MLERGSAAMVKPVDRPFRLPEPDSDLARRQAGQVTKDQHLALFLG